MTAVQHSSDTYGGPQALERETGTRDPLRSARRGRALGALLLAAAALLAAGLAWRYWPNRAASPSYRLAEVTTGPITAAVIASGTVNPVISVQVGSQVSGQIKALYADFNTEVKKDQLVARIDPDLFESQVAQATADLAVARANVPVQRAALQTAQANLEAARSNLTVAQAQTVKSRAALADAIRDYERKRTLAETGAQSVAVRDTALATRDQNQAQVAANEAQELSQTAAVRSVEAQIKTAEANVEMANAQVLQKEAVLRQAQVNLDHTYIRAPVDGTVILRNVDVGQTVAASLQAPVLFTIAQDLSAMQVDASIDEADVGGIRNRQKVLFTVDAYPAKTFEGQVVQIRKSPQVVQNVVTYDVVISAPNPELLLLPGLTANVRIIMAHRDSALRVPNAAMRFRPTRAGRPEHRAAASGEAQIFVPDEDGKPRQLTVKLGISDGTWTEVVDGLGGTQRVIVGEGSAAAAPAVSPTLTMGPRF